MTSLQEKLRREVDCKGLNKLNKARYIFNTINLQSKRKNAKSKGKDYQQNDIPEVTKRHQSLR